MINKTNERAVGTLTFISIYFLPPTKEKKNSPNVDYFNNPAVDFILRQITFETSYFTIE